MNLNKIGRIAFPALAALCLAAGGCIFEVRFDSAPPGAEVLFGDVHVGNTPLLMVFNADNHTVASVHAGGRERRVFERDTSRPWWGGATVTVRKDGYEPQVRELKFGGPQKHSFDLKPLRARAGAAPAPAAAKAAAPAPADIPAGAPAPAASPAVVTGMPIEVSRATRPAAGRSPVVGRPMQSRRLPESRVMVGIPVQPAVSPATASVSPTPHAAQAVTRGPMAPADARRVSIAGALETAKPDALPARAVPMSSIGLSFFSIDPARATSIDHIVYGARFTIPLGAGDDFDLDLLMDVAFAHVTVRRAGPSVSTELILGFEFGIGLKTLLPRKLIPVNLGEEAWLRFGSSLEVPFIYSMVKGDMWAFGYPEGADSPEYTDYIFYGTRLSLYAELHGKADWNVLVPHAGFGFDILWQGSINDRNFTREGFPMLMLLGAKAVIGKHTFVLFDLNFWTDQVELALSLDMKM